MKTQISPMLAVSGGTDAVEFYQKAFGAVLLWQIRGEHIVAGLSIDSAEFFLASPSPEYGTQSPDAVSFTTVRIECLLEQSTTVPLWNTITPRSAPARSPRMLQGAVTDPFGHLWLIGKFLE
jgi:PhnB protein